MSKESRYSKVFVKIWHSKDFRAISKDGKCFYVLLSSRTQYGGFIIFLYHIFVMILP